MKVRLSGGLMKLITSLALSGVLALPAACTHRPERPSVIGVVGNKEYALNVEDTPLYLACPSPLGMDAVGGAKSRSNSQTTRTSWRSTGRFAFHTAQFASQSPTLVRLKSSYPPDCVDQFCNVLSAHRYIHSYLRFT